MKAMRLVAEGGPLSEQSVDVPALGPRSALVRVEAAGVCHSDIHLVSGAYDLGAGRKLSATGGGRLLPITPGHEIAGRVQALGKEAARSGVREGDEVMVYPWIGCGVCRKCLSGKENLCEGSPAFLGFMKDGGYAEYVVAPDVRYLVRRDGLDAGPAATLTCSGLTALSAVKKCALGHGDLLVLIGAGGLGTAAVQLAKRTTGARVVVADVDDSKLELASSLGADQGVNTAGADAKELVSKIKGENQGRGADAVLDFVGRPETVSLGLRLLGHEGRLVMVGLVGGAAQVSLPILPLLGARIQGNFTGTLPELKELVGLARDGTFSPVVTGAFRLEDANDVLGKLARGEIRGRAVLKP